MKKLVLIAFLLVCGMFSAGLFRAAAQNNPYDIDDECYKYFKEAELLVGKPGFDEVNDALLHAAITKGDTKAQTIYNVERLKNAIHLIPTQGGTIPEEDTRILKFQEELKEVADKYGFPQYYYYSYELVQNYFFNHHQPIRTMELLHILSALNSNEDVVKGFNVGADDFIMKPIIMEKLLTCVVTQLQLVEAKQ